MEKFLFIPILFLSCLCFGQMDKPVLTLNTGMHTAKIGRIDTDKAGKYVLTCSHDKTAKLWSADTGRLLQTYRPPIGKGNEGMLYAAAISPDAKYVAVGGWSSSYSKYQNHDIYIFDAPTGILVHRISNLNNVINDLEFSLDGRFLAAALGGGVGIRIHDTKNWSLLKKDTDYANRSENLIFSQKNILITVSRDGYIRKYNSDFELIKKVKTTGGKRPYSLASSPDNRLLAVGYDDSPTIQVLDAVTLKVLYEPSLGNANDNNNRFNKVKFSKDGKKLIAGGNYSKKQVDSKYWQLIRIWENQGRGDFKDYPAAESTIMDIKTLANGNILYCSVQPDWGILDLNTGNKTVYKKSDLNDHLKSDRNHFKINTNANKVNWTPAYENSISFDVATRKLEEKISMFPSYKSQSSQIEITDWEDTYQPQLNGNNLSFLKKYERCRSVDIAEHQQSMVFGTAWNLYALNTEGDKIWETSTQTENWAVNIAANNKVVAACQGDGTIRWYRMSDGALLLTLYVHPDRQRWVLWTPSGYYDAAAGAEELIGWHVNQGEDSEGLYYPISKFRSTYYRPDVIDRILNVVDETKALRLADEAAGRNTATTRDIVNELPPTVRILSPTAGTKVQVNSIDIEYSIKSPNNEQITGVKVLVDGRPIAHERGLKPAGQRQTIRINVPSADCTVSVIAENRFGASPSASVDLQWAGQLTFSSNFKKPNLYIVAVGVGDYDVDSYDLDYADDDAKAFAGALLEQKGLLYNDVQVKLLTDKRATKNNILDGLDWLVRETTQHDVAMIFFAGHGVEDLRGTFYYLPVGANADAMRRTCLMKTEIQETVAVIPGKVVVFMDACHSGSLMLASSRKRGNPDISRIVNELIEAENGAVVFSSSTGRQSSLEDDRWKHGAFTMALVEGLNGAAEYNNEGKITCKSLDYYITQRVKTLTGGQQTPTTNFPPNVSDFPISILKKK